MSSFIFVRPVRKEYARLPIRSMAVAEVAYKSKLASSRKPADVLAHISSHMYDPRYRNYA